MIPNMSALPVSSTVSTERPTGIPAARKSVVCGKPKPIRSSLKGETLTEQPAAFTAAISSLLAATA